MGKWHLNQRMNKISLIIYCFLVRPRFSKFHIVALVCGGLKVGYSEDFFIKVLLNDTHCCC